MSSTVFTAFCPFALWELHRFLIVVGYTVGYTDDTDATDDTEATDDGFATGAGSRVATGATGAT